MFFKYALTILISIVAIMQFAQVVIRYVLQIPFSGLEEILVYPTLWLYMIGSINASRTNTQITANVLEIFLKTDKQRLILNACAFFCSSVVALWLTYWAWDYENYARRVWKESPTLYVPMYLAEVALFIGMALMSCYALFYFIKTVMKIVNYSEAQGEVS